MKRNRSLLLMVLTAIFALLTVPALLARAAAAPQNQAPIITGQYRGLSPVIHFDVSPPLRSLAPAEINIQDTIEILDDRDAIGPDAVYGPQDADGALQDFFGSASRDIPSPSVGFDGPSNIAGVAPPDPVGDVGPNHYVAMSNLYFAIYSKTGTLLYGPAATNTLWSGFGGECQADNSGDPVVLYDQLADRWLLTQFTASGPTYSECLAISTTGDPTGSYYRYEIGTGTNFPDYPKLGVWPDGYYVSTREFLSTGPFAGVGAYAMNRDQMIAGNPSPQIISFLIAPGGTAYNVGDGLLPADLDGTTLPPAGSPNYWVGSMDNGGPYGAPQDALTVWKYHVDWVTPGNSYFNLTNTLATAAFDSIFPCGTGRACISQSGTTNKLDILSYRQRPTWRLAYRNFGTHESLVTNQSVEATTAVAGVRWYEIRLSGGTPSIYQQGTYSPNSTNRWMGSVAMDKDGNLAVAYSASSSSMFPSLWYTGRLSGDPLGTLPQGEAVFHTGTGSQTGGGNRWGDYSSLNVDPVDDCTFWYVNEYVPTTSASGWRLRIGAFKFASCDSGPTPTPGPTATPTNTPTPTPGPSNTGLLSPSANAPVTTGSGDNNGYEGSPANAYGNDASVAVDTDSGTGTQTSCTSNRKDRHTYYNYNISVPGGATINGIEVRLDGKADSVTGAPKFCVQISWDGGVSWTTALSSATLTTTEATYVLGGPTNTWGRAWATGELTNANFRIRIVNVASNTARDFTLDYIAVNVYYTP